MQIPETGLPVDEELDIAVDFFSPSVPGRYMSYWQMVSPFGQKFGQEVWVIIQVLCKTLPIHFPILEQKCRSFYFKVTRLYTGGSALDYICTWQLYAIVLTQVDDHHQRASAFLNMNLPTKSSQQNNKVAVDVGEPEPLDSNKLSVKMLAYDMFNSTQLGGTSVLPSATQISNPYIDISKSLHPASYHPLIDTPSDALAEEDMVEQTLLRELEEMGFKQIDLNKEILRQNQYDLEQSLEDLFAFIEWDPLLQ